MTLIWGFSAFSVLAVDVSSNNHNHSYMLLINAKLLSLINLARFKPSVLLFSVQLEDCSSCAAGYREAALGEWKERKFYTV